MDVKTGVDLPKLIRPGRERGRGANLDLLNSLGPSDTVWDVGYNKMRSIIASAHVAGIKLMVRKIPNTNKYAFKVIANDSKADAS